VSLSPGPNSIAASIETTRENLPAVLRLTAEVLREPSFPGRKSSNSSNKKPWRASKNSSREPQAVAGTEFGRHLNPYPKGDVRYISTPEEDIAEVNAAKLEDLKKFYADFYGGSNGTMAVVGDFDAKEIDKLVGELFGSWKSPRPFSRLVTVYQDIPPINQSLETPDKANAVFLAGMRLDLRDDDPDYPALCLETTCLEEGF